MVEISQLKDDLVHEMRRNDEETSHLQVKGQGWTNWPEVFCTYNNFESLVVY